MSMNGMYDPDITAAGS